MLIHVYLNVICFSSHLLYISSLSMWPFNSEHAKDGSSMITFMFILVVVWLRDPSIDMNICRRRILNNFNAFIHLFI